MRSTPLELGYLAVSRMNLVAVASGAILLVSGAFQWTLAAVGTASSLPEFVLRMIDQASPSNPWTKITGDLDGDGRADLIVGGQKGPLVWYRSPGWSKHLIAQDGWDTVSGVVGDVDNDGDLDVLMGGSVWFENPGQLQSAPDQAWTRHVIGNDPTHDIVAADFDGDGLLDAATRNQSEFGAKAGNRIRVWLQRPGREWAEHAVECPHGEGLAVADLDQDNDPDIVIGGSWFETVRAEGGVQWQAHRFAEWHANATVAVADFNGDRGRRQDQTFIIARTSSNQ